MSDDLLRIDPKVRSGTVVIDGEAKAVGFLDRPHLGNCQCDACRQWSATRGQPEWKSYVCQQCFRLFEQDEFVFFVEPPQCPVCGVKCVTSRYHCSVHGQ